MNDKDALWPQKRAKVVKKECKIRDLKVHGEEHINHVGKLVPARRTGNDCRFVLTVSSLHVWDSCRLHNNVYVGFC